MMLLDNFAGTFPQWVSAAIALATLIIALIAKFQTNKIKELVDITNALSKQTEELASQTGELIKQTEINRKRFELEADIALFSSIPFFRPHETHH